MGAIIGLLSTAGSCLLTAPMLAFSTFCCCCQGLSCVCSTINLIACCCQSATGKKSGISPRLAKIFYILILGCAMILALILRFNSENFNLGVLTVSCSSSNASVTIEGFTQGVFVYCKGEAAVFRISFILSCFFGMMIILSIFSERAHRGFWFFKLILIIGAIIGSFFMPESSFDSNAYAWVSRFGSLLFLILQLLVLIDFSYQWNTRWVEIADDTGNRKWLVAIIVSALLLYSFSIAGIALLYVFYGTCDIGKAFTSITLIFCVLITILSVFREQIVSENHPGAILPSAVICAYAVFLCWSSLDSNPDVTCGPPLEQTTLSIILGALWASITLCWTTFTITDNAAHLVKGEDIEMAPVEDDVEKKGKPGAGGPIVRAADIGQQRGGEEEDEDSDAPVYSRERAFVFHIIMTSASMYIAMLLTDWGTFAGTSASLDGNASMWVKIGAQWTVLLLFTWTLIAPGVAHRCCKDREFS